MCKFLDLDELEKDLKRLVEKEDLYWTRNEAKFRACRQLSMLQIRLWRSWRSLKQIHTNAALRRPQLHLSKRDMMMDERISIKISDLAPKMPVSVHVNVNDPDQNLYFESRNEFVAADGSVLDLSKATPSKGYSYPDSMGIFWSMKWMEKGCDRFIPCDVTKSVEYKISVKDDDGKTLCSESVYGRYMHPEVRRIRVKEGRIRGTLFMPPKKDSSSRFPSVIRIYGGIHRRNVMEFDAALMAGRGFITFALGFFGFEDLPSDYFKSIDIEYFEEAIDYVMSLEDVDSTHGIGICGISKGGDIVQALACEYPDKIGAICVQNGCVSPVFTSLCRNGVDVYPPIDFKIDRMKFRDDGAIDISGMIDSVEDCPETVIPIEKYPGDVLWMAGEDDFNFPSAKYALHAKRRMKSAGKKNYEVYTYPGMGHFLHPPFTPVASHSSHPLTPKGNRVFFGGHPELQVQGQEDAWIKVIKFFKKSLLKEDRR